MEKTDLVFVLLQAPMGQLQNPENPVTKYMKDSQVKSILDIQVFPGHWGWGWAQ